MNIFIFVFGQEFHIHVTLDRLGLEKGLTLDFWAHPSTLAKTVFLTDVVNKKKRKQWKRMEKYVVH